MTIIIIAKTAIPDLITQRENINKLPLNWREKQQQQQCQLRAEKNANTNVRVG